MVGWYLSPCPKESPEKGQGLGNTAQAQWKALLLRPLEPPTPLPIMGCEFEMKGVVSVLPKMLWSTFVLSLTHRVGEHGGDESLGKAVGKRVASPLSTSSWVGWIDS